VKYPKIPTPIKMKLKTNPAKVLILRTLMITSSYSKSINVVATHPSITHTRMIIAVIGSVFEKE
jgi:uncharacterized protein YaeQ